MIDIASNIKFLRQQIPDSVKIVAVSKTKPVSDILIAFNAGQRIFGENRVQELLLKKSSLPNDISWHLIGHLQSNKVKLVVPFISMIHSVDSFRLLSVINNEALKYGNVVNCLLQFHIAKEETKFGFDLAEVIQMVESIDFKSLKNVKVCGVMGMATLTEDNQAVRMEFKELRTCFETLKEKYFSDDPFFSEISMGMSGDYKIAIEEGSTVVRIGSLIFGDRG
jgi:pyridoxal phosphate enzyme (YggS family)